MITMEHLTSQPKLEQVLASRVPAEFRRGSILPPRLGRDQHVRVLHYHHLERTNRSGSGLTPGTQRMVSDACYGYWQASHMVTSNGHRERVTPARATRRIAWSCRVDHGAQLVPARKLRIAMNHRIGSNR